MKSEIIFMANGGEGGEMPQLAQTSEVRVSEPSAAFPQIGEKESQPKTPNRGGSILRRTFVEPLKRGRDRLVQKYIDSISFVRPGIDTKKYATTIGNQEETDQAAILHLREQIAEAGGSPTIREMVARDTDQQPKTTEEVGVPRDEVSLKEIIDSSPEDVQQKLQESGKRDLYERVLTLSEKGTDNLTPVENEELAKGVEELSKDPVLGKVQNESGAGNPPTENTNLTTKDENGLTPAPTSPDVENGTGEPQVSAPVEGGVEVMPAPSEMAQTAKDLVKEAKEKGITLPAPVLKAAKELEEAGTDDEANKNADKWMTKKKALHALYVLILLTIALYSGATYAVSSAVGGRKR